LSAWQAWRVTDQQDAYIHGHHDSVLRSHRWRTIHNSAAYLIPHLRPDQQLLDVGCGPGTITIDLAQMVAPGNVVGIDNEPVPLEQARAMRSGRAPAMCPSPWATFTR
jgi:ubiquinone/menaquinone biosynthesis C-methylase UbiE